jgi:predicted nucleic acid-binding protein
MNLSPKSYLLDTSAILAFYQGEPGSEVVRGLFEARDRGEATIYVSFMTIFELAYIVKSRAGDAQASSFIVEVRSLEMDEVWPDEALMWSAADIKARAGLSAADAFVAASSIAADAVLAHRDPELDRDIPGLTCLNIVESRRD